MRISSGSAAFCWLPQCGGRIGAKRWAVERALRRGNAGSLGAQDAAYSGHLSRRGSSRSAEMAPREDDGVDSSFPG